MARRAVEDGCGAEEGLPHDHWYEACTKNKFWLADMKKVAAEAKGQLHQALTKGPLNITRQWFPTEESNSQATTSPSAPPAVKRSPPSSPRKVGR